LDSLLFCPSFSRLFIHGLPWSKWRGGIRDEERQQQERNKD
jgi:hypothetical protein